jgi:hypothetical protein
VEGAGRVGVECLNGGAGSGAVEVPVPLHETRDAGFDRRRRRVTGVALQGHDIGVRVRHVAGLQRQQPLLRLAAEAVLEHLDVAQQFHRLVVADVVDAVWRAGRGGRGCQRVVAGIGAWHVVEGADHALDDVVDVGEVAGVAAVVEHVDRFAGQDLAREQEQGHVRPAPGAVDGEKAQAGGRQAEQVAVGMRHQFVGLLGGRVHAHRVVDAVLDGERQLAVVAVDRTRRGIHQVLDAVVAAGLQDVHEADDVALDVGVWILQRVAHAGLRGEVDHPLRPEVGEGRVERGAVLQRRAQEREPGQWCQPRQPRFLQPRVVVVVEVVVAEHLVAARQQALAEFRTDEAGGAGDEDAHDGVFRCLERRGKG